MALISDIKTYRIKNAIIVPFIMVGLATNFILSGPAGVLHSSAAVLLPFLLLIILYIARMLGAGDIKLFSAIGSIMGVKFVLYAVAYSFLLGGVIALVIMLVRKNGIKRLSYLMKYIENCFLTFSVQPYMNFNDKSDGARFHFAYAIACGTFIRVIYDLFSVF